MADEDPGLADPTLPTAGWYADPRVPHQLRWWDGDGWSTNVHMPDRPPEPAGADVVSGLAEQAGSKWDWPQP